MWVRQARTWGSQLSSSSPQGDGREPRGCSSARFSWLRVCSLLSHAMSVHEPGEPARVELLIATSGGCRVTTKPTAVQQTRTATLSAADASDKLPNSDLPQRP